ncbi:MAG: hypothetical protein ACI8RD_012020 [Bacillariaceae sp.]|jgi:hypothetical protein
MTYKTARCYQLAPGVTKNRPHDGALPLYEDKLAPGGHTTLVANTWYENLELNGNTSINPYFYGTYLAETKPNEPVTRNKNQAFQADAPGVNHQLTPAHFTKVHTFRIEWQPGPGGRVDWFSKDHKINSTLSIEGDGLGKDWLHIYGINDKSLKDLMRSQIPIEPSYLIMNTAVSSNWGFPYVSPETCPKKCYDCDDPKCACAFAPGFCKMLRETDVAMKIDSVRVYQSRDPSAHPGQNHTLGCDPPAYPTREWIKGHSYQYMRNPPFSFEDKGHPLKKVQKGGGKCGSDYDCGAHISNVNLTEVYDNPQDTDTSRRHLKKETNSDEQIGRGKCVSSKEFSGPLFTAASNAKRVCKCNSGYSGPHCLAQNHIDDTESAYAKKMGKSLFKSIPTVIFSPVLAFGLVGLFILVVVFACTVAAKKREAKELERQLY